VGGALAGIGWRFPFLLPLAAIPIGLIVLFAFDTPPFQARDGGGQLRAVLHNARREGIVGLSLLAVLVFILLYGAYLSYLPFLLEERFDASPSLIGFIMSTMSVATAAVASQRGAVARRFSTPVTLTVALICYSAALILIPLMPIVWLVMVPTLLYGVAQGLTIPTIQSQIAARAPMELRGATVAANGMAIRLGQTLGPLLAGLVAAAAGSRAVFWTGAAVPVVMLAIVWTAIDSRGRKEP
jgi:predicted MFS family arabinose efflux permease